jgi:hypothetical protein
MNLESVRITSDGTPRGTRVFDRDGKDISKLVSRVEWSIQARGAERLARAVLTFVVAAAEVEATDVEVANEDSVTCCEAGTCQ